MIDAHIHFSQSMGAERLKEIIKEMELEAIALLCIPVQPSARSLESSASALAANSGTDIPCL